MDKDKEANTVQDNGADSNRMEAGHTQRQTRYEIKSSQKKTAENVLYGDDDDNDVSILSVNSKNVNNEQNREDELSSDLYCSGELIMSGYETSEEGESVQRKLQIDHSIDFASFVQIANRCFPDMVNDTTGQENDYNHLLGADANYSSKKDGDHANMHKNNTPHDTSPQSWIGKDRVKDQVTTGDDYRVARSAAVSPDHSRSSLSNMLPNSRTQVERSRKNEDYNKEVDIMVDVSDRKTVEYESGQLQKHPGYDMEPPQKDAERMYYDVMSLEESDDNADKGVLENEDYHDNQSVSMKSVDTDYNFSDSDNDSNAGDTPFDENIQNINKISKRFDANLVVQSIKRGESTLQRIKERDCVLIVGKTGTGKSTLIQAMAGKKIYAMQLDRLDEGKYQHDTTKFIAPDAPRKIIVYEATDPLQGFEIGHEKKSKTSSIHCFEYDPSEHTQPMNIVNRRVHSKSSSSLSSQKIMFVDPPGFEDTSGHEADVATSILLSQVAKNCRSLKFVIMISFVSLIDDRGGSMRSLLRLIRSFSKDFKEERRSFMFLFTHCNHIQGVADSIDGAKRSIYQEIVHIMDDTEDEDTKEVLKYIERSLKKGYPFVDVFLPLQTNVQGLTRNIQKDLKPMKDPHLANHCGLTQSSRLTLSGELQQRLQELRRDMSGVINGRDMPMDNICTGLELFDYFHNYISTQDIRDAVQKAKHLLDNFVKENMEMLRKGMEKATGPDHNFGPADINDMKESFVRLQTLQKKYPNIVNCQDLETKMNERMDEFIASLMIREGQSFNGMHRNLTKLKVWSSYFPQYLNRFEDVKNHLVLLIQKYIHQCEDMDEIPNFLQLTHDKLGHYIKTLVVLHSIYQDGEYLSLHGFDIECVSHAYHSAVKSIESSVESMENKSCEVFKRQNLDDQALRCIGTISHKIEHLDKLLTQSLIFPKLKKYVENFKQQLSDDLTVYLETVVADIPFDGTEQSQMIMGILRQTKLASEVFSGNEEDLFREIPIIHERVVEKTKLLLTKRMGEIQQITQDVKKQGIIDGEENARMISGLRDACWFDSFLPDNGKFVKNFCIAIERVFLDRINQVRNEVKNLLDQIADESYNLERPTKTLRVLWPELVQISQFAKAMKINGSEIEEEARKGLLGVITSVTEKYKQCIKDWGKLFFVENSNSNIDEVAEKLEQVLRKINSLQGLDVQCDTQISLLLCNQVENAMGEISNHLKKTMEASKKYKEKFRLLQITHAMTKFSHLLQYLPRVKDLQVVARNTIASDAEEIQNLVSQTSEWDEIDSLLVQFEEAKMLDEFTWNEASSRIAPLLKLREQKQEEVDNLLDKMIVDEDFKGIDDFLLPYAQSKDQVKNQQFQKWLFRIRSTLSHTINLISSNLQGDMSTSKSKSIIKGMEKLGQAEKQKRLTQYLEFEPCSLYLSNLRSGLKQAINKNFQSLLTEFEAAIQNANFEAMGIKNHFIQEHSLFIEQNYICDHQVTKMKSLCNSYNRQSENVINTMMQRYIDSNFKEYKKFSCLLSTLKNAIKCTEPQLVDLEIRYENVRKELTNGLNKFVLSMSEHLSETKCYEDVIDVMNSLDRHLKCEFKDHIICEQLLFSSEELLREWREEKQKIDREMEFDGSDAKEKLHRWRHWLNRLDPSGDKQKRKSFLGIRYQRKVTEIYRIINERSASGGKALKDGDYNLLGECIKILDLIHINLCRHVLDADRLSKKLQESAKEEFLSICDRAEGVLQSDNPIQFESMFSDYRGLILYVPCVIEDFKCKKAYSLVNQLVHDALDSDIKKVHNLLGDFAFGIVHKEIARARKFGNFIADHCTLLKEEINRCSHINTNDKWLEKIFDICYKHYSGGRVFGSIKDFAILGLPPSANQSAVNTAYKRLALKYHPDKSGSNETSVLFRSVTEAKERLLGVISSKGEYDLPFTALIKDIGISLRKTATECLEEQRYDRVERILFALNDLKSLSTLVSPPLNHGEIIDEIHQLVRSNVRQAKMTVESSWSSREYKAMNDAITDLRMMEDKFKSYEKIFPSSWNDGIVQSVEKEIEALGSRARQYLSNKKSAKENLDDFRRCFLNMGHVLVELPLFKPFTKAIMSYVLEVCLQNDWGYSFLFEFGLGLQRGDENGNEDDNNVAQMLVAEFSHFKEVMTMVWNEETSQKPAEDTVHGIEAKHRVNGVNCKLDLDKDQLLESYGKFEAEYKKLLGEYIIPDADLSSLVYKTITLAEKLHPLDLSSGWNDNVKTRIPCILAGVFTVFTVLKSGASYNRLESTSTDASEKLLMKPHNIQVLTLLSLFGCGTPGSKSTGLDSQLMQIRTGEGKSMILGAAAVLLALLGFRVRCVCYSEYLSTRDFNLFQDIFDIFNVTKFVKYSKITTLSEDTTAAKGDIRSLTDALLRRKLEDASTPVRKSNNISSNELKISTTNKESNVGAEYTINSSNGLNISVSNKESNEVETDGVRKEILLVDEVDVFFGGDFYGQTYNQVTYFREPEIVEILNHIWINNKRNNYRQRLADVKSIPSYRKLVDKMPHFKSLIDAEISLMTDQVRKVNEEPYYLDEKTDRIGYKVMDSISFEATYGYRTVFVYLQEAERGNLRHKDETLQRVLAMPISCGQFSYANISPERILGVSGTLSALDDFEYSVLSKYGVDKFMYVPSVYGESNFQFDKAGKGICIDKSTSDYFHSITNRIKELTKEKRAVIVFFENTTRLEEFTKSSFYPKLGRQKKLLLENLSAGDKEFIISKAATAKQITISTAIFGRGTDFFCKDETVQKNGGVHVIQTFLSEEQSEEIQIQGRTARQGKKGSYEMILLASDLEEKFGLPENMKDNVAKERWYEELCAARDKFRDSCHHTIKKNLIDATEKDKATHSYFDSLLSKNEPEATTRFNDLYKSFKKGQMPSAMELDIALLVDLTGSMAPYASSVTKTANMILQGSGSISEKLKSSYPDTKFTLRVGIMGFRDIDDDPQFIETTFGGVSHFTTDINAAMNHLKSITGNPYGGGDLAEDHLGAIDRSSNWNADDDWTSPIKFMLVFTDAPAHGMVPDGSKGVANVDNYSVRHPSGLTGESAIESLVRNEIDLFFCSFNPNATSITEQALSALYMKHPDNTEQREIICIPMVPLHNEVVPAHMSGMTKVLGGHVQHIVFVLDMSGSMSRDWSGVVAAYNQYLQRRRHSQCECDLVSVVQFDSSTQVAVDMLPISQAPSELPYRGGGTKFLPAANSAFTLVSKTPSTHTPVVVFMSDGEANDAHDATEKFSELNRNIHQSHADDLELHVIAFRGGASTTQLQQIAGSSRNGKLHTSADTAELSDIFVEIAGGADVAVQLEAEIGKRISDAVSDKLSVEYLG